MDDSHEHQGVCLVCLHREWCGVWFARAACLLCKIADVDRPADKQTGSIVVTRAISAEGTVQLACLHVLWMDAEHCVGV
jgi:hypothetical protein